MENTVYRTVARDLLFPIGRIGLIVVLVMAGYDLVGVGYAYILAAAASCLVAHYLLHRLVPLVGQFRTTRPNWSASRHRWSSRVSSAETLTRTDTLMLGALSDSYEVAMYNAARPLAGGMLIVLSAFGFLYLPMMSRLDADARRERMDRIYKTTTTADIRRHVSRVPDVRLFPADVLRVFFGPAYTDGAPALVILSVGFFVNALLGATARRCPRSA